jgi:hypothetical protein
MAGVVTMPLHRRVDTRPYRIELGDEAGPFDVRYFKYFESMLEQAVKWSKQYPRKVLVPSNSDRADYDFDGLTEEERERFWEVLSENALK